MLAIETCQSRWPRREWPAMTPFHPSPLSGGVATSWSFRRQLLGLSGGRSGAVTTVRGPLACHGCRQELAARRERVSLHVFQLASSASPSRSWTEPSRRAAPAQPRSFALRWSAHGVPEAAVSCALVRSVALRLHEGNYLNVTPNYRTSRNVFQAWLVARFGHTAATGGAIKRMVSSSEPGFAIWQ